MSDDSFKFELDSSGVGQLLKSSRVQRMCKNYASSVKRSAEGMSENAEYKIETKTGRYRVKSYVSADSARTYYSELKHNYLLKALMASTNED